MGKWLEKAQREELPDRAVSVFSADSSSGNPNGTKDTKGTLRRSPDASVREWRVNLDALDWATPLHALEMPRWRGLLDDAHWLLDHFGNQAARDGWSTFDLFGVMPGRDGWGGIADRLRSSRSLMMSADVAKWRRVVNGEPESFARGLGETVRMVPIWEPRAD